MDDVRKQKKPAVYKTVVNVADILRDLSDGINTVTDIAEARQLSKSTVSRLLDMMVYSNLAIYDPIRRRYYLGPLINILAANPKANHFKLVGISTDEIDRLSEISGELVSLSILVGLTVEHLRTIPSRDDIQILERKQVFQGATIKTLLSQLKDEELESIVDLIQLESVTELSVADKNLYIRQIKEIRKNGYSITSGERIPGVVAVSVPVKNYYFPAVLSMIGFESKLKTRTSALLKQMITAADRISDKIEKIK
jgi:IclR family transcriptional regulator, KDG regulon repressor